MQANFVFLAEVKLEPGKLNGMLILVPVTSVEMASNAL